MINLNNNEKEMFKSKVKDILITCDLDTEAEDDTYVTELVNRFLTDFSSDKIMGLNQKNEETVYKVVDEILAELEDSIHPKVVTATREIFEIDKLNDENYKTVAVCLLSSYIMTMVLDCVIEALTRTSKEL